MKLENIKPGMRVELKPATPCYRHGEANRGVVLAVAEARPWVGVVFLPDGRRRPLVVHPDGLRREAVL